MAHWFYSIRSISFHFFSLKFTVYCTVFYRCSGLYGLYPPPVYHLPEPTYVLYFMTSLSQMFWPLQPLSSTCVSSPWTYLWTSWPLFYRCSGLYGLHPPPVYHLPGPTYVLHDLSFTDVLASTASILHLCIISLDLPMYFMTSILQMFWPLRLLSSTCVSSPWIGTGLSPTPSPTPSRWATGEKSAKFR